MFVHYYIESLSLALNLTSNFFLVFFGEESNLFVPLKLVYYNLIKHLPMIRIDSYIFCMIELHNNLFIFTKWIYAKEFIYIYLPMIELHNKPFTHEEEITLITRELGRDIAYYMQEQGFKPRTLHFSIQFN
jgi:hypothetical protein